MIIARKTKQAHINNELLQPIELATECKFQLILSLLSQKVNCLNIIIIEFKVINGEKFPQN